MQPPLGTLPDSEAFEQLCFDALQAEGFTDLVWRGPSADGGRDIEATWKTQDPAGAVFSTRWYVECKWYTDSLPFEQIEQKLLAATAARVDCLFIITSSRIRNTAIDAVTQWLHARGNPFRIRYWTGRDVLRSTVIHPEVFARHFPGIAIPSWGNEAAQISRLRALSSSSADRLTWRAIPILQRVHAGLAWAASQSAPVSADLVSELELLICSLRGHELFSNRNQEAPSLRVQQVGQLVDFALKSVERRHPRAVWERRTECECHLSRPLFVAAIFEVVFNAAQYCEEGLARVSLDVNAPAFTVEVRNKSSEALAKEMPAIGLRGPLARKINGGGQGLGCWVAREAALLLKMKIDWAIEGEEWVVRIQGAIA